jgi:hypothetical protein
LIFVQSYIGNAISEVEKHVRPLTNRERNELCHRRHDGGGTSEPVEYIRNYGDSHIALRLKMAQSMDAVHKIGNS